MYHGQTEQIARRVWEWKLGGSGEILEAGNYSKPFELALPGNTVRVSFPARINDNRK